MTLLERFESRLNKTPTCWLWVGRHTAYGYGKLKVARRTTTSNRVAWELYRGPIPPSLWVLHKCDVPACCNPDHLFLGTAKDNAVDSQQKGRRAWGMRHPFRKLTVEQVLEIRETKHGQRGLAKHYGVSRQTIRAVRNRRLWEQLIPMPRCEVVGG